MEKERRQAIMRVVTTSDEKTWFASMTGDADLAQREKERFQNFVRPVKFPAGDGPQK